jgi:hypothetical protein
MRTWGCVVPTLAGRTLAGARKLLRRHRCALGRVSGAQARGRLRVAGQRPARLTRHRAGAHVQITLRPVA